MSFFKKFGTIEYKIDGFSKEAMNIVTAAILKRMNIDKNYILQRYVVQAGASPESIANDLYKDPHKYWTVLFVNSIVNPFLEWPMKPEVLEEVVKIKYGNPNTILYFTNLTNGFRLDDVAEKAMRTFIESSPMPAHIHPVTAIAHEQELNRQRGEIYVIGPKYINLFVDTFHKVIEGKE